jgi:hypothetical protein
MMKWEEVRAAFPGQWVVIEALKTQSNNGLMTVEDMAVVSRFGDDGTAALKAATVMCRMYITRQYFPFHTGRERVEIVVRERFGQMKSESGVGTHHPY